VLWENACYLLPDHRRAAVFEALREQVGLTPEAILRRPREVLLPLAAMGGMRPETRVFRWQEIAHITATSFEGNLEQILQWPHARAMKALKLFPSIGDPGAEKILLFCGVAAGLPLESKRSARADADRVRTGAPEELRRDVPLRAGGPSRRNCQRRPAVGPRPSAACARTARRSAATASRSATNARSRTAAPSGIQALPKAVARQVAERNR